MSACDPFNARNVLVLALILSRKFQQDCRRDVEPPFHRRPRVKRISVENRLPVLSYNRVSTSRTETDPMSDHRLDIPHALIQLPMHLERALKSLAAVGQRRIRAEVEGDAVVLKGVVRSYYHKQLAQETIRAVDGVGTIRNDIIVAPNLLSANRSPVSF